MKKLFEFVLDCRVISRALAVVALILLAIAIRFGVRGVQQQNALDLATREKQQLESEQKSEAQIEALLGQQDERRKEFEAKIPFVDGYIWLSKFMHGAGPGLQIMVDPPDLTTQDLISSNEYTTGIFHVRGTGSIENLVNLLKACENDLPFAHIRDLQFSFVEEKSTKIQFNLVVVLVMRLHGATADTGGNLPLHIATN